MLIFLKSQLFIEILQRLSCSLKIFLQDFYYINPKIQDFKRVEHESKVSETFHIFSPFKGCVNFESSWTH